VAPIKQAIALSLLLKLTNAIKVVYLIFLGSFRQHESISPNTEKASSNSYFVTVGLILREKMFVSFFVF
jgi:hypothetical protein